MKIIKLDGRFRYYPEFDRALRYSWTEEQAARQITAWLYTQYGAWQELKHDTEKDTIRTVLNPMWRVDKKKRRIYFKNQADISMALLLTG